MSDFAWQPILRDHFGIVDAEQIDQINSHNTHYRFSSRAAGGEFLLSRRSIPGGQARFRFTHALLNELQPHLATLQQPRPTQAGLDYVMRGRHYWQLVDFVDTTDVDWTELHLIRESARRLAEFHNVAATLRARFPLAQRDLKSFEWCMHEWHRSIDGHVKTLIRSGTYDDDTSRQIKHFASRHQAMAAKCIDIVETEELFGFTHQDYRPANLCVVNDTIKYIWDWDLARTDVVLYDVAFAALQFGAREVVYPDFRPDLARTFIAEYANARGIAANNNAFTRVLSWCFIAVVLKRLLNGWHVESRRQVLNELLEEGLVRI